MKTVICLGSKACDIGELFENNKNYIVKLIDIDIEGDNCFNLKRQSSPEEYEKNTPNLSKFFSNITNDILFITSYCDPVSSSLKILEQIKDKNITVLYLFPDTDFLTSTFYLENKVIFSVFQEYARSGLFKQLILIDERKIDSSIGDISIEDFHNKYNEFIYQTINSVESINALEPILSNYTEPKDVSRICTYGFYDIKNNIENLFFDFNIVDDKCYNFVINEDELKNDKILLKKIKEKMKQNNSNNAKITYKIFSCNGDSYCYIMLNTKYIQEI